MRIESTPFTMDLNWKGKTTKFMFSLVMGVATEQQYTNPALTHPCRECFCGREDIPLQPTLLIRNLSEEHIDLAKIFVARKVLYEESAKITEFKSDSVEHKVTLKRHEQKVFASYKDLTNFYKYPGDNVTFEFNFKMEVFKVVTK